MVSLFLVKATVLGSVGESELILSPRFWNFLAGHGKPKFIFKLAFSWTQIASFSGGGSITVQLTSCLTGLDLTKKSITVANQTWAMQLNPNQINRRSAVPTVIHPLKLVFSGYNQPDQTNPRPPTSRIRKDKTWRRRPGATPPPAPALSRRPMGTFSIRDVRSWANVRRGPRGSRSRRWTRFVGTSVPVTPPKIIFMIFLVDKSVVHNNQTRQKGIARKKSYAPSVWPEKIAKCL